MDDRSLEVLEYPKIVLALAAMTTWTLGKEKAFELLASNCPQEVQERQEETSEARAFLESHPGWQMGGIRDVRTPVSRASKGAILAPEDLLDLASTAMAGKNVRRYLEEHAKDKGILGQLASGIQDFSVFYKEALRSISEDATIKDSASPELARTRALMKSTASRLKERLEGMVRSPNVARYLQDPIVTLRGGRYVIPVKQEHRSAVPGIIHDQSSSGATLFVEPEACVSLNNEIRRLEMEEKEEVRKVLMRLSLLVSEDRAKWEETLESLGQLDFVLAKAKLALEWNAIRPLQADHAAIDLKGARHPLLGPEAVPIDIRLGDDFDILIVTGPNTGGKTVSLKTVGLLTLLHQAGLQIPAKDGSRLGVFNEVLCDIGDEQSIEQSLSTFSSHMNNTVRFIRRAEPGTLILLDEMGAGTDPVEGSSLAMAILDHLAESGARVLATTHYSELKTYAFQKERVENAAMEFDPVSLKPTFRLIMGLPGRSNAFEISEKLGLYPDIIGNARSYLEDRQSRADSLIRQIEEDTIRLDHEWKSAQEATKRATQTLGDLYRELEEIKSDREAILSRAREEAKALLRKAEREVRSALKDLKHAREAGATQMARETRERLSMAREAIQEKPSPQPGAPPQDLEPGDTVFLTGMGVKGTVMDGPDEDGQVLVEAGALRVRVPLLDLREAKESHAQVTRESLGALAVAKAQTFSPELDLRGLTQEESLLLADKYLDDAGLTGAREVKIIHGKGTGALRRAITEFLSHHPLIISFRPGGPGEGGDGVTIARLS